MGEARWDQIAAPGDPLPARSFAEAALYLRVRGAEILAARRREVRGKTLLEIRARHEGDERRFAFWLHHLDTDDLLALGGANPSELLDPVDLVLFAGRVEDGLPKALDGLRPYAIRRHLEDLDLAAEAVLEALKFVPPGDDVVPRETLMTRAAEWLYDQYPERFTHEALVGLHFRLQRRAVWYQEALRLVTPRA